MKKTKDINIAIVSEIATLALERLKKNHINLRKEYPVLDCQQFRYENYISYLKIYDNGKRKLVLFEISDSEKFKNEFYRITQKNFFNLVKRDICREIERRYSIELMIGNNANKDDVLDGAEFMDNFSPAVTIHRIKISHDKNIKIMT